MAITNGYATVNQVTDLSEGIEELGDDTVTLESIIEGVSRWIDWDRGRRFYAASETRYYRPVSGDLVVIDDLLSLTTLKTDEDGDQTFERSWTSSDYELWPYNASTDGKPYVAIERSKLGSLVFPVGFRSVEAAGSFGYTSTTPEAIERACVLISLRIWDGPRVRYGSFIAARQIGRIVPLVMDPNIRALLDTVPKRWTRKWAIAGSRR